MFSEKCLHLIKCSLSTKHFLGLDQYLLDQRKFCSACKSFLHWTAQPPVGSSSNSLEDLRNCRAVQFCKKQQKAPTKHMIKLFNLIPTFSFSPVIHAWFISSVIFFMQRNLKGWFHTSIFLFRFFFSCFSMFFWEYGLRRGELFSSTWKLDSNFGFSHNSWNQWQAQWKQLSYFGGNFRKKTKKTTKPKKPRLLLHHRNRSVMCVYSVAFFNHELIRTFSLNIPQIP